MENSSPLNKTTPDPILTSPPITPPHNSNILKLIIGLLLILLPMVGASAYYLGAQSTEPSLITELPREEVSTPSPESVNNDPTACTMDAKVCPDGSAVGRVGPNCEFAECPPAETARGGGVEEDWPTYSDPYNGYSIRYPKEWVLIASECANCAMNLLPVPWDSDEFRENPNAIGIMVFDTNSQSLSQWRDTNVVETSEFTWHNLQGEKRVEKRTDFFHLGPEVEMEVLYSQKGSKTVVIYTYPSILPVENLIISSFEME